MSSTYTWIVYLHLLSILAFLAAHGITIGTVFKLRRENNQEEAKVLLNLSRGSLVLAGAALFSTLATGIALGFLGNWWSQLWIWTALVIFFIGYTVMSILGTRAYDRVRLSLGLKPFYKQRGSHTADSLKTSEQTPAKIMLPHTNYLTLTLLGGAGLIFILWLMIFKPF